MCWSDDKKNNHKKKISLFSRPRTSNQKTILKLVCIWCMNWDPNIFFIDKSKWSPNKFWNIGSNFKATPHIFHFSYIVALGFTYIWIVWYVNIGKLGGNAEREKRKNKWWLKNLFIYTRKCWSLRRRKTRTPSCSFTSMNLTCFPD